MGEVCERCGIGPVENPPHSSFVGMHHGAQRCIDALKAQLHQAQEWREKAEKVVAAVKHKIVLEIASGSREPTPASLALDEALSALETGKEKAP